MEIIIPAVCGLLGILCTKIFDLVSERKKVSNETKQELSNIHSQLEELKAQAQLTEKDNLRTQLMVMIKDFPSEKTDILRLGQHYFNDLHGNWVLTDLYRKWVVEENVQLPTWLPEEKKDE